MASTASFLAKKFLLLIDGGSLLWIEFLYAVYLKLMQEFFRYMMTYKNPCDCIDPYNCFYYVSTFSNPINQNQILFESDL